MRSHIATFLALLATPTAIFAQNTTCVEGLYMVVARASTEAPGLGIIGQVCTIIQNMIANSTSVAVQYPATLTDYMSSESQGVAGMTSLLEDYVNACPGHKVALLGYSQGAQVVGDTLCGTSETGFNTTAPVAAMYRDPIVAAIQMGDPSYVPGLPYDAGTSQISGIFNRTNPAGCNSSASILQSYCDTNDLYCAKGKSLKVHVSYIQEYGQQAAEIVVSKYRAAISGNNTSSGSSTMTGTATTSQTSMTTGSAVTSSVTSAQDGARSSAAGVTTGGTTATTSGASGASASSSTSDAGMRSHGYKHTSLLGGICVIVAVSIGLF